MKLTKTEQSILSQQIREKGCNICTKGTLLSSGKYICKVGVKHPSCLEKGGKFELIDD